MSHIIIGVAPITLLRTCVINMAKDFPYHKELFLKERIRSFVSNFFTLQKVPILKMEAIEKNRCLIQ